MCKKNDLFFYYFKFSALNKKKMCSLYSKEREREKGGGLHHVKMRK